MGKERRLLEKIVRKNYKNKLEEVLSEKDFSADVKNLLLDIIYKFEIIYNDYYKIKRNVCSKEKYIENIIETISSCQNITFINRSNKEELKGKSYIIDKKNRNIMCYPMENKLLYCLAEIRKLDDIVRTKDELINKSLTDIINIGNNINMVEPLRDFNGFSWNIAVDEIENVLCNLIYQDLILLIGNDFLEKWTKKNESLVDYVEVLKNSIEIDYGKDLAKDIIETIFELSIMIEFVLNEEIFKIAQKRKDEIEDEIANMNNKEKFLEDITHRKKVWIRKIRNIDMIINNKQLLVAEYQKRNKNLPLEKKIFSLKVLTKILEKEREELLWYIDENNKLMNPKQYKTIYNNLQKEYKYYKLANIEDYSRKLSYLIIKLQKLVTKCLIIKTRNTDEKSEIIKILHEVRYYNLLPLKEDINLDNNKQLEILLNSLKKEILSKARKDKVIIEIFRNPENDLNFLKEIFSWNIISLEDIYIKIAKESEHYYIYFYEEDMMEKKLVLDFKFEKKDLRIKFGKKYKLFT